MDDIIKLESNKQDGASDYINYLYDLAVNHKSVSSRNLLKKIYEDKWEVIKNRMNTEGSIWYVWYMDGVNKLLSMK